MLRSITATAPLIDAGDAKFPARRDLIGGLWLLPLAYARHIGERWAQRRRINQAIAQLSGLNDRMLRDIGVARHDIERIVRHGHDASELGR